MSYQIITDSCCDFTEAQYKKLDVTCVPLTVMWDGVSHSHFSTEEALKDFYDRMRFGLIATTSALNPDNWLQAMEPWLQQGRDLLVLTVSSGISAAYQSECIAAQDQAEAYPEREIRVVDSLSGSLGEGRLSGAGALLGTMLDIKPIIRVTEEGKLVSDAKVRGRKASLRMLAKKFAQSRDPKSEELVTIA